MSEFEFGIDSGVEFGRGVDLQAVSDIAPDELSGERLVCSVLVVAGAQCSATQ